MGKGKIAIFGSGLIGRNWCMIFTSVGYEVHLFDVTKEQTDNALKLVQQSLQEFEEQGILKGKLSAKEQFALVHASDDLPSLLKDAIHCQECVFEDVQLKKTVFTQIDKHISNNEITVASSTSVHLPSTFTEGLKHNQNYLVAHPINPPYFVPLVEIVPAPWTSIKAVQKVQALMNEVGQSPIVMSKELFGFAVNRIQFAILNECYSMVKNKVLSAEDVDKVMRDGLGLRYAFMGPWETCHLNADGIKDYMKKFGKGVYDVSSTFEPLEKIEGETLDRISEELNEKVPINTIEERRKWRDERIKHIVSLKKRLENN